MQKTTNYNLNQWEAADPIRREDFNADNAAIDAALNSLNTAVGSKAEQSAVTAVQAAMGNCRIAVGSYTGNGKFGASNARKLTFDFKPYLVIVGSDDNAANDVGPSVLIRGRSYGTPDAGAEGISNYRMNLTWSNTWVSWYNELEQEMQNNVSGVVYYYAALGIKE